MDGRTSPAKTWKGIDHRCCSCVVRSCRERTLISAIVCISVTMLLPPAMHPRVASGAGCQREAGQRVGLAQMRWKTSVPRILTTRPFGATYVAIHLAATVVGLTNRPDQTVVTLQSGVHVLDV